MENCVSFFSSQPDVCHISITLAQADTGYTLLVGLAQVDIYFEVFGSWKIVDIFLTQPDFCHITITLALVGTGYTLLVGLAQVNIYVEVFGLWKIVYPFFIAA